MSAPLTSWLRFTCTTSPARNGLVGVRVTDLSRLENVNGPVAVPLCLPKTRKLDAVIVVRSTGTSNVIVTAAVPDAMARRAGLRLDGSTAIGQALPAVNTTTTGTSMDTSPARSPYITCPLFGPRRSPVANGVTYTALRARYGSTKLRPQPSSCAQRVRGGAGGSPAARSGAA